MEGVGIDSCAAAIGVAGGSGEATVGTATNDGEAAVREAGGAADRADASGKCTLSLGCPRTAQDVLET